MNSSTKSKSVFGNLSLIKDIKGGSLFIIIEWNFAYFLSAKELLVECLNIIDMQSHPQGGAGEVERRLYLFTHRENYPTNFIHIRIWEEYRRFFKQASAPRHPYLCIWNTQTQKYHWNNSYNITLNTRYNACNIFCEG